jgi:prepilin peptidase CpaA
VFRPISKGLGVINNALLLIFPFAMAFAAATDLLTMKIPNWLSIGLCVAFVVIAPLSGLSGQQMLMHLATGALVLIAGIALFALGWMGGGDGKILAVASLWIGFDQLVTFLAYVAIAGGVLAVAILAYRRVPAGALPLPGWAMRLHDPGEGIPYGLAIAAGALIVYPTTVWYAALAH